MRQATTLQLLLGLLVALVGLTLPTTAQAGGWSVVTLEEGPPDAPVVGQSFDIRFTVRQHGVRPINGLSPTVRLTHLLSGEQLTTTARPTGSDGQYTASLRLPREGRWDWEIEAFGPAAQLAPLQVVAAAAQPVPAQRSTALASAPLPETAVQPWLLLALGVAVGGALLLLARRRNVNS